MSASQPVMETPVSEASGVTLDPFGEGMLEDAVETEQGKRTLGNRVWIGLLSFCLVLFLALDCFAVYIAVTEQFTPWQVLVRVVWLGFLTWTIYRALRRRISITGADKFPGF